VTEQADQLDWTEAERQARRSAVWSGLLATAFFGSVVLLTGGFAFWEGRAAWIVVGLLVTPMVVLQVVGIVRSRTSERTAQGLRFRYALLHRVDPGPGLREKVDVYARQMSTLGWLAWVLPLTPLSFLAAGRWDRPLVAVPAALVLVGIGAAYAAWWRRSTVAARAWVADPPGPPREVPPPTRRERMGSGRGFAWLFLSLFVLIVLASVAAVALLGD
jgi:hypothetical protein